MKLARNQDKIHTRNCRYVVTPTWWTWAEPRSRETIVAACRENGLTECRTCKPFDGELFDPWFSNDQGKRAQR